MKVIIGVTSKLILFKIIFYKLNIDEKFVGERGRINCSLREKNNFWRWLGIQFVLADK